MFRKLYRFSNYLKYKWENYNYIQEDNRKNHVKDCIPRDINIIEERLKRIFTNSSDFVIRKIIIKEKYEVIITYIDGLVNNRFINEDILKPLMIETKQNYHEEDFNKNTIIDLIDKEILPSSNVLRLKAFDDTINYVLSGDTVIYIDGVSTAITIDTKGAESRGIEEPLTEATVRGPREGFNESLRTNTSLLRRKIKDRNLKFEEMQIGERTKTKVCISYIEGIARKDIIEMVKNRLNKIKIDAILESGYIEEFIEDNPFSILPLVGNSERPDKTAAKLLEGRVAILCDGTPFVLTVPYLFIEALQSSEDYYSKPFFASIIRNLRILALLISLYLPALYVAFITYHPQSIPFKLLISMASSREGIPFSSFIEALVMLTAFELLREAGVRMPRPVGQAVSIVGALVLGEAAVQAGIASNLMIIVTAITAICTFIIPALGGVASMLRIFLLISGNLLGFMGIFLASIIILTHMFRQKSFGVLYMEPFISLDLRKYKDTFVRVPLWMMFTRPEFLAWRYNDKQKYRMKVSFKKKED